MNIQGLQKTTLLDFPGHVAATVFLGGCNFRCPFCHNMDIVINSAAPAFSTDDILHFLEKRKGILDGVCITGGEPTLYHDLTDFIKDIKSLGYMVKLDTNGSNPEMLENLISLKLIDYAAVDIKSSPDGYSEITGVPNIDTGKISDTVHILNRSSTDHEFRTTLIKEYHTFSVLEDIGRLLHGSPKYFLQSFVDSEYVPDHTLTPFCSEELIKIKQLFEKYISVVEIRGVDI